MRLVIHGPWMMAGLGFRFALLPIFVGAFFFGQLAGGRMHARGAQGSPGA